MKELVCWITRLVNPQNEAGLNGGREVQRCIYLVAAQALLGQNIETTARLLFVKTGEQLELPEPQNSFVDELCKWHQ